MINSVCPILPDPLQFIVLIAFTSLIALTVGGGWTGMTYASHGSSPAACEADGYEAGQDGPFSQELYEMCEEVGGADEYYNAFIEGCMSVKGNTRDVCEAATD